LIEVFDVKVKQELFESMDLPFDKISTMVGAVKIILRHGLASITGLEITIEDVKISLSLPKKPEHWE
jgi:ABC-type sulfate transport system permease subunit